MASPGVYADLHAQRSCWHPVAHGHELGDTPSHADLLGEPLVLWRGPDREPHAMSDLCVHRGTALSLGWVSGNQIVCPYHGWRYAADGRCVAIPQLDDPARVPARARVPAFRIQERYGLIWVALEEPRWPLPEVPELEDHAWAVVSAGPYSWRCDAARQVENFTDFGHFPWVHPGLLGDPARPVVPRHEVRAEGHVLHYSIVRPEAPNTDDFPVFGNDQASPPERRSRYELHLPYTIALRLDWGGQRGMVYLFAAQPVAADRCTGYVVIGRNYNFGQSAEVIQEFENTIFGQDRVIVESQRPERVPFDLAAELHLKFDAVAVAYRKAMRAHGLAASMPGPRPPGTAGANLPG
ncbi:MAG TPA: aromatic ring-hydroxylating dioxygenase subunit alpha [Streptosporangiaceae bacterium]|nr:aromatic ring-hydroxylating dioxygenase subunit alpha [Streptosporangiaceae bacterium]